MRVRLNDVDSQYEIELHDEVSSTKIFVISLKCKGLDASASIYLPDLEAPLSAYFQAISEGRELPPWSSVEGELTVTAERARFVAPGDRVYTAITFELSTEEVQTAQWSCQLSLAVIDEELQRFIPELAALERAICDRPLR